MEVFKTLLIELTKSLRVEILEYYTRFYSYTLDLLEHKNVKIETKINQNNEELNLGIINKIVETIISALNSIGVSSTSFDFRDNLTNEFLIHSKKGIGNYMELFDIVGRKPINRSLFSILFEFIVDIDTEKLDNLDLFDLLPKNFKSKLIKFKKKNILQDKDKINVKSLYPSIEKIFNPTSLEIRDVSISNNNEDMDILKKLHEAKEKNINALKNPVINDVQQNSSLDAGVSQSDMTKMLDEQKHDVIIPDQSLKPLIGNNYFNLIGNLPAIKSEITSMLKINFGNLESIAFKKPELFDLENLFYYISINKILGLPLPFKTEEIIDILTRYVSGKIFSTGMYHISNPLSNFYGLSILSELKLIKDIEIIDLLDIEMFLENELKNYLPQKLLLNYFTLLSLKILEEWGVILTEKKHLLSDQLNYRNISKDDKGLPLDLLCQLTLIKLLDNDTDLRWFKESYKEPLKLLISKNGLINDNLTDSARVLLIFKLLGIKYNDDSSVNILLNSILSKINVFQEIERNNQFHWSIDAWALKVELRMTFWVLIALQRYEHVFEVTN